MRKSFCRLTALLLTLILLPRGTALGLSVPDTTININDSAHFSGELILHSPKTHYEGSWYPGLAKKGTIRIANTSFHKVQINNIALKIECFSDNDRLGAFIENMRLSLRKVDEINPVYDGAFSGILWVEGSGYKGRDVNIVVDRLEYVDFECTVSMNYNAGHKMQGLSSKISLLIKAGEVPAPSFDDPIVHKEEYIIEDLAPDHWAYENIQILIRNNIIDIEPGNKIRPQDSITRSEAAVLIARALGIKPVNKLFSGYLDPLPDEARGYIVALTEAGIFKGYPGWLFKPDKTITREELACVLVRAFEIKQKWDVDLNFTDREGISDWALDDVKAALEHNLLGGYPDGSFRPESFSTRAESFSIICRILFPELN